MIRRTIRGSYSGPDAIRIPTLTSRRPSGRLEIPAKTTAVATFTFERCNNHNVLLRPEQRGIQDWRGGTWCTVAWSRLTREASATAQAAAVKVVRDRLVIERALAVASAASR
jgi:hypothetical protein